MLQRLALYFETSARKKIQSRSTVVEISRSRPLFEALKPIHKEKFNVPLSGDEHKDLFYFVRHLKTFTGLAEIAKSKGKAKQSRETALGSSEQHQTCSRDSSSKHV